MIQLPLEQAQAIRAYLGTRPFDEVAAACLWLDAAIRASQGGGSSRLAQMQAAALRADHEMAQRAEADYRDNRQPQESTDAR